MIRLSKRLQILLEPEQFELLQQLSRQRNTSVGELVREAVEQSYQPSSSLRQRRALERLRRHAAITSVEPLESLIDALHHQRSGSAGAGGAGGR